MKCGQICTGHVKPHGPPAATKLSGWPVPHACIAALSRMRRGLCCAASDVKPCALCARSVDADGRAPLHWAAYKGFPDTLRLLLVAGADLERGDREGCTPLHWAAIRGNGEAVTLLLRARPPPRAAPARRSARPDHTPKSVSGVSSQGCAGPPPPGVASQRCFRYCAVSLVSSLLLTKTAVPLSQAAHPGGGGSGSWQAYAMNAGTHLLENPHC